MLTFIQGVLVLTVTFGIVIQSGNVIELFKDFVTMQVILDNGNAAFHLVKHVFLAMYRKETWMHNEKLK